MVVLIRITVLSETQSLVRPDNLEILLQSCERQQLKSPADTHRTGAFIASSEKLLVTPSLHEGGLPGQGNGLRELYQQDSSDHVISSFIAWQANKRLSKDPSLAVGL